MSKFMYYNGKIKEIIEYQNRVDVLFDVNNIISFPKQEFYRVYSDAKIVDNLEDLIEVGDVVEINNFNNYEASVEIDRLKSIRTMNSGRKEYNFENRTIGGLDMFEKYIISIYKHIGKDFIRVCHKENGEWKVD